MSRSSLTLPEASLRHFPPDTQELRESEHLATALSFPEVFSDDECGRIRALGSGRMHYQSAQSHPVEGVRGARTLWIDPSPETLFISERLAWVISRLKPHFGFEIHGFRDPFVLLQYSLGDGFEWHLDVSNRETSTRKLSISVQLSAPDDYEGGRFEFMPQGEIPFSRDRGSIIVFPSYLCHRVTRVTKGIRWSLVTWAHGPCFR